MVNANRIFVILLFFIYIIFCCVIYLIVADKYADLQNKKVKKLNETFGKIILNQLNDLKEGIVLSALDITLVKNKLNRKKYFRVFNESIKEFNRLEPNYNITKGYMENFQDIIEGVIKRVRFQDNIDKAYVATYLAEYGVYNERFNKFLLNNLHQEDLDLRSISLRALSKIGSSDNLIKGIQDLSTEGKYIHNKVLIDTLSLFKGNKEILNQKLLKEFYTFNDSIKKAIIEYLAYFEVEDKGEELVELLKSKDLHKEVKLSIIRYFSRIKYPKVKSEIIKALHDEEWEFRVIAAKALRNYKDRDSIEALMGGLGDRNWHVRYNSAQSLLAFNEDKIIEEALQKDDKYSKEILGYVMKSREKNREDKVKVL